MIWDRKIVRHEGIKSNDKSKCVSLYEYPYTGQQQQNNNIGNNCNNYEVMKEDVL